VVIDDHDAGSAYHDVVIDDHDAVTRDHHAET
jgi:hypothetical protein